MKSKFHSIRILLSVLAALILLFGVVGAAAGASFAAKGPLGGEIRTGTHPVTGMLSFVGADPAAPIRVQGAVGEGIAAQTRAEPILRSYAPQFGVQNPSEELIVLREKEEFGQQTIRYQQVYQGVPVLAGELILNMNDGGLISMNGEASPFLAINTEPTLNAGQARETALGLVAKHYNLNTALLTASEPALWIYDERLLTDSKLRPAHLVWRVEVRAEGLPVRELVLINARNGRISLNFNQIDTFWGTGEINGTAMKKAAAPPASIQPAPPAVLGTPVLQTFDSQGTSNQRYVWVCTTNSRSCSIGEANQAHRFAYDTYNIYAAPPFSRDSINGAGMNIISNVNWYLTDYCPNAFWDGDEMTYCSGLAADDVVAHELTHGVTQYESNLFYMWESGAINESISDIWGEYVDQNNTIYGDSDDSLANRWKMGEDTVGMGVIRDMYNPPAYGQPNSMTHSYYYEGTGDNGGVHYNSGVNNKAAQLMVDGGTLNNKTVSALGWAKTTAIYYEAQTNLLTSGSGYYELYNALYQACVNKVGTSFIALADCQEVRDATDAVKMNIEPATNFNPNADACPAGTSLHQYLFSEDFETGSDGWTTGAAIGSWNNWSQWTDTVWTNSYWGWGPNAYDGTESFYGDDYPGPDTGGNFPPHEYLLNESWLISPSVTLPPGSKPYLRFAQFIGFEYGGTSYYDGGVLEYSTNGGVSWTNASALFSGGQNMKGTISSSYSNPLGGQKAFVGDSHGYVQSRFNLSSLAGQTVNFRFRMGTDVSTAYWGWFIDDFEVNTCLGIPSMPSLTYPASNALLTDYTPTFNWSDSTGDLHHYNIQVDDNSDFNTTLVDDSTAGTASEYTPISDLPSNVKLYWRVQSENAAGGTSAWTASRYYRSAIQPPNTLAPGAEMPNPYEQLFTRRPTFTWDAISGVTGYTLEVSTSSTFGTKAINKTLTPNSYTHTADLAANTIYFWRVKANGTNGPSLYSQVRTFRTANPPSVPTLASPANNALLTTTTPLLNWNNSTVPAGSAAFDGYTWQIAEDSAFNTMVHEGFRMGITESQVVSPPLPNGDTYYWRVRSNNVGADGLAGTLDDQLSGWSVVRYFRVAFAGPTLQLPADTATGVALKPTFTWTATIGATSYVLNVSKVPTFATLALNKTVYTNSYTHTLNLTANTLYYWRVKVNGPYGPGSWSTIFTFTTTP